jgi:zinc transporter ZupT
VRLAVIVCFLAAFLPVAAFADADEQLPPGVSPLAVGLQPLAGPIPIPTAVPGESPIKHREDGTYEAIPDVRGHTETFHLTARQTPWALQQGLFVMANSYNGVVPGPTLVVKQNDHVVIDFHNLLPVADTIHLHGIHGISDAMDGVEGISQQPVPPGGRFRYEFTATQPGTFIYHTHGPRALLDSGLYGAIVVQPAHPRPEERVDRDDVEILSSWSIQSVAPNHFTINGREYPATWPVEVKEGDRVRIRWINISSEDIHTMHTHGHDQLIIARDAQPVSARDVQDTVFLGPGQRVDVVIDADQKPGNWLVHCHVLDHTEDAQGMPAGLITEIHYAGVPMTLPAMGHAMRATVMQANGTSGSMTAPLGASHGPLSFAWTALLGAIAGLTIFLGLPVARLRHATPAVMAALNALAIGILVYLIVEIAGSATSQVLAALHNWRLGAPASAFAELAALYVVGLLVGLVGLGALANRVAQRDGGSSERPLVIAGMVALGIGAHNFAEGLAIGASASSGMTAIALTLIIGFALHNATEGFAVAAPLAGRVTPTWGDLARLGVIAGGPTFLGALIGYAFSSPALNVLFLTIAVGALVFVVGELWGVLKRLGLTVTATTMLAIGFVVAFATEVFLDLSA